MAPLINLTRPLGLFTNSGNALYRKGKKGKAFVRKVDPKTGKMKKVYNVKAVARRQGMLRSMKGVPRANRPTNAYLNSCKK
jgi:hypothetical protein